MILLIEILLAYILIDFLSGIYHILTDYGWNIKSQVDMFQEHHKTGKMDSPGLDMTLWVALPIFLFALYFGSIFWIVMSIFVLLVQVPHYYAHVNTPPFIVSVLQKYHIIIGKNHDKHHEYFDNTFCIVSGWNNYWMNPLIRFLSR